MGEVKTVYPLIHNKVTAPHYVTPLLRRARLLDWLTENQNCRAIVIAADAGYGKTTLLWQWEREVKFPCYWYKLDRQDRDWSLQISYLIESIAQRNPGFGHKAHSMLLQLGGPGSSRPGVAAFLLSEMHERLTEPCTFIIDDWQFVASQTEVRGLWNQIIRDAPHTCRFIFLSRARPQLQFARFRTHAGYAELLGEQLRFSGPEIEELFRDVYNDPLEPAEVAELDRRTEGWAAGLQLVEVSLRERQTREGRRAFIDSIAGTTQNELFNFLAEEVLDQQTEDNRNFLLSTSILQQITPELAERLAGVIDGATFLRDFEHRGLFTYRLDPETQRYRYHGLFRDFLARRLKQDRSGAEVVGLHIHAASYFETTEQWPEAIHHYLQAGLQRQAARLIARYGEDVAAEGRLGMVDDWLSQLPSKTIRDNARLSLLHGEALGIVRGRWVDGETALRRALEFFEKKGDTRQTSLALLKLSSLLHYLGRTTESAEAAQMGLERAGSLDPILNLRLRGNLAITSVWMESIAEVEDACEGLVDQAEANGLGHFAAIARHNLGLAQFTAGKLAAASTNLGLAESFWAEVPGSPFSDAADYVAALLALGHQDIAAATAERAELRTRTWPRPHAEALIGVALCRIQEERYEEGLRILRRLLADEALLGGLAEHCRILQLETLVLADGRPAEIADALERMRRQPHDERLSAGSRVAEVLALHQLGQCTGACTLALELVESWGTKGARLTRARGSLLLAPLMAEHGRSDASDIALRAARELIELGAARFCRTWIRRSAELIAHPTPPAEANLLVADLVRQDPDFWATFAIPHLQQSKAPARALLLEALEDTASPQTTTALGSLSGQDIEEAVSRLHLRFAPRLYVNAFGYLTVRVGSKDGPELDISKRRVRLLLGLLVAGQGKPARRDVILDALWPDSEADAALNNLNQTVFQLRRLLHLHHGVDWDPPYLAMTPDAIALNSEYVITDLDDFRTSARAFRTDSSVSARIEAARQMVSIVTGPYLGDLQYEDWAVPSQTSVHAEVRENLLTIAEVGNGVPHDLAFRAAGVLLSLDEFDEAACDAAVRQLSAGGRPRAATELLQTMQARLDQELGVPLPDHLASLMHGLTYQTKPRVN